MSGTDQITVYKPIDLNTTNHNHSWKGSQSAHRSVPTPWHFNLEPATLAEQPLLPVETARAVSALETTTPAPMHQHPVAFRLEPLVEIRNHLPCPTLVLRLRRRRPHPSEPKLQRLPRAEHRFPSVVRQARKRTTQQRIPNPVCPICPKMDALRFIYPFYSYRTFLFFRRSVILYLFYRQFTLASGTTFPFPQ